MSNQLTPQQARKRADLFCEAATMWADAAKHAEAEGQLGDAVFYSEQRRYCLAQAVAYLNQAKRKPNV